MSSAATSGKKGVKTRKEAGEMHAELSFLGEITNDLSQLRQPIELGTPGAIQIHKCFADGTSEVRNLLTNECDIVLECRACKSLFRSLANFIAHKRVYCQKAHQNFAFVPKLQEQETIIHRPNVEGMTSESSKYPIVGKMLAPGKSLNVDYLKKVAERENEKKAAKSVSMIELKPVANSEVAVSQTLVRGDKYVTNDVSDKIRATKKKTVSLETINVEGEDVVVIRPEGPGDARSVPSPTSNYSSDGSDGKLSIVERLRQRSDCSIKDIRCLKCYSTFTTLKSLARHMTALHSNKRVYYPCLYCPAIFSQTSSAVRHIARIHNKKQDDAEILRTDLKEHSFVKEVEEFDIGEELKASPVRTWLMKKEPEVDPGTELRTTVSTDNIIDKPRQKNSNRVQKVQPIATEKEEKARKSPVRYTCVCKKGFHTSWNYSQHIKVCELFKLRNKKQPPINTPTNKPTYILKSTETMKSSSLSIAKKAKDLKSKHRRYTKPEARYKCMTCNRMFGSSWNYAQHIQSCGKAATSNFTAAKLAASLKIKKGLTYKSIKSSIRGSRLTSAMKIGQKYKSKNSDDNKPLKRKIGRPKLLHRKTDTMSESGGKKKVLQKSQDDLDHTPEELKRIHQVVNEKELMCLKCNRKYSTLSYLHRHAVRHLGWKRFKCKLCKFTAYNRSECTTHVRKVHASKIAGVKDLDTCIRDLEPEKRNQEPSLLVRVGRPALNRSDSVSSITLENYNISTRNSPRHFDTKPYIRNTETSSSVETSPVSLLTRKRTYQKADLINSKSECQNEDKSKKSRPETYKVDASNSSGRRKMFYPKKSENSDNRIKLQLTESAESSKAPTLCHLLNKGPSSVTGMSQKIENRVQSDMDKVLQMVQRSNVATPINNNNLSEDVVILVVGDRDAKSPLKNSAAPNDAVKMSKKKKVPTATLR